MLQGSINEKIKECKWSIHQVHNPIYNLEVEIEALQWVQGQIQHLVINNDKNMIQSSRVDWANSSNFGMSSVYLGVS
jgi:hypothetical protein